VSGLPVVASHTRAVWFPLAVTTRKRAKLIAGDRRVVHGMQWTRIRSSGDKRYFMHALLLKQRGDGIEVEGMVSLYNRLRLLCRTRNPIQPHGHVFDVGTESSIWCPQRE
jgi:hypothetical protein